MIEKKNLKLLVFVIISLLLIAVSSSSLMGFFYGYRSLRINIPTSEGKLLTGKLYIPSSIKNENTPAVLICHGANNEYSAMESYAAKLAASGCTALLFNPYNHGQSDVAETTSMGASDALKYIFSLDFVDKNRIGAIGHTMGGYNLSVAAEETNLPLKAVLNIDYVDISGSLKRLFNHTENLGFILARYDEHQKNGNTEKNKALLSELYSNNETGKRATIYSEGKHKAIVIIEDINTSLLMASSAALNDAVEFFSMTLGYENEPSPNLNLFFQAKSIMLLVLFITLSVLLTLSAYPPTENEETEQSKIATLILIAGSILVFAVFPPLYMIGKKLLMPNAIFPETDTNGLVIWSVFTGFIMIAASFIKENQTMNKISRNITGDVLRAFAIFGFLYLVNLLIIWLSESNIFILFSSLSPFTRRKALSWIIYLPLFLVGFTGFSSFVSTYAKGRYKLAKFIIFYTFGPVFMIFLFFLGFPIKGELMFYESRFALIPMIYMLPFTPLFALLDFWGQKRSGGIVFPATINALLFSWLFVASNALYILL